MPWSTGTECVAKYNFQATNEQDLPFAKGDVLTIIGVTRVREAHHTHTDFTDFCRFRFTDLL